MRPFKGASLPDPSRTEARAGLPDLSPLVHRLAEARYVARGSGLRHRRPVDGGAVTDRCCMYLRVSSEEQDLQGQRRELREYAERWGWLVSGEYAEKVSGTGKVQRAEY